MPTSESGHRGYRSRGNKATNPSSKQTASNGTPGSYQMSRMTHSSSNVADAKGAHMSVTRQISGDSDQDGDTASEECIIPKRDRRESNSGCGEDVERGRERLEVTVDTTYDVRPTSVGDADRAESIPVSDNSPDPYHGRFWDRRWEKRGCGNSVTIGSALDHR